jgi:hypothetical protein
MDKLTLDTNILRDWIWCEGKSQEIRYPNDPGKKESLKSLFFLLKKWSKQDICELGITNQIYTDYEKSANELPEQIEKMIGKYIDISTPSISTFPMVFPFVFADENEIEQILNMVFPNTKPHHKKYPKNRKDALQLYAHRVAKRDFFLTSDQSILNTKNRLKNPWGIKVMDLESYIEYKEGSHNQ